jgi:hypothetical protein
VFQDDLFPPFIPSLRFAQEGDFPAVWLKKGNEELANNTYIRIR